MSYVVQNAQYHTLQRRKWDFMWYFSTWHLDQKARHKIPCYFQHLLSNIIKLISRVITLTSFSVVMQVSTMLTISLCNWAEHAIIIHQPWKKAQSSVYIKNVIGIRYRKNGNMLLFTTHHILWGCWYCLHKTTLPYRKKKATVNKIHGDFPIP